MNKVKVLLVDDSPMILSFEKMMLRDSDFEIFTATSGKEALEMVKANSPAIVLLDVQMPEMDGIECCRQLKSNPQTKPIPVIMVTTKGQQATMMEAYRAGCNDFVTKPIDKAELLQKIDGHLKRAGSAT